MVFEEVELVVERENRRLAAEATLTKVAIDTGIAAFGKNLRQANRSFEDLVKRLNGNDDPAPPKRNRTVVDGAERR